MRVTGTQSSWQSDPNQLQGHSNAPNPLSKAFWSWPYLACDEGSQESGRQSRPKPVGDGYLSCQGFQLLPQRKHQRILPDTLAFGVNRRPGFTDTFSQWILTAPSLRISGSKHSSLQIVAPVRRTCARKTTSLRHPHSHTSFQKQVKQKTPCKWVKRQPPLLLTL